MKRTILFISSLVVAGSAVGIGAASLASADSTSTGTHSTHVKHVRLEARLNQAVRDGTITASQKTAFQNELKTLKSERKTAISKSSTKEERQTERAKLKTELQSWASSNNFPLAKIAPKLAS